MQSKIKSSISSLILLISDLLIIFISLFFAHFIRNYLNNFLEIEYIDEVEKYISLIWLYFILIIFFIYEGIYIKRYDFWQETKKIYGSIIFTFFILFSFLALSKTTSEYSRLLIIISFLLMFFLFPISKLIVKKLLFKINLWQKELYFIGNSSEAKSIKTFLNNNWYLGYTLSGKFSNNIFISNKSFEPKEASKILDKHLLNYKEVLFLPYFESINLAKADIYELNEARINLISIKNNLLLKYNSILKIIFEFILITLSLPLLIILFIFIAFMIKIDSKGSVFFKQKRLGKNGELFECIKFRTMYTHSNKILHDYFNKNEKAKTIWQEYHKLPNDPRITKVGKLLRKYSLDELPQIINILKGEMSLIGPRPYMIEEADKIGENLNIIRMVKPGISGLWQVSGRNSLTFKERNLIDVYYVRNWSLWLDFVIILKTFKAIFKNKGIL